MSASITTPSNLEGNQSPLILWTAGSVITLAVVSVFLRFVSRIATKVPLLLDDWLILATLPIAVATSTITIWGCIYHHLGTHVLATATVDSLHDFLRGLYVFEILYAFAVAGTKFSMMAIYWRLFPHPQMKWPLVVTAGVTAAWLIATVLVPIFSCNPIQGFWLFEIEKTCIDSLKFYIGSAATNISIDMAMLLIPITTVMRLRISFCRKLAVSAIFGLGVFVTACSCLRLNQLIIANSEGFYTDPTWNLVGSGLWSDIEINASIVCACLPTMRPLLRLVWKGTLKEGSRLSRSVTGRSGGSRSSSNLVARTSKGRYQRFSDDRPLSGLEGKGDWLGKGVGAPGFAGPKIMTTEIEMRDSPPPLLTPPPPAYTYGRGPAPSISPPLPSRSPHRHMVKTLDHPGDYGSIIDTYNRDTYVEKRAPHHQYSSSAPPLPTQPTTRPTAAQAPSQLPHHNFDIDLEANARPTTRTIVRDPRTNKYVLSPLSGSGGGSGSTPRVVAEQRLVPDWAAGWEDELDRRVDRMWDPSRRPSAATAAASDTASIYNWTRHASAASLPRIAPRAEFERRADGDGLPRWQWRGEEPAPRGHRAYASEDLNRGGWF